MSTGIINELSRLSGISVKLLTKKDNVGLIERYESSQQALLDLVCDNLDGKSMQKSIDDLLDNTVKCNYKSWLEQYSCYEIEGKCYRILF